MQSKKNKKSKYKKVSVIKPNECPFCKSKTIIKWGWRYNHTTKKQRWKCKSCSQLFTVLREKFKLDENDCKEIIESCQLIEDTMSWKLKS